MNMLKKQIVNIEGMMCEGCARTVTSVLAQLPGVKKVNVSYKKGTAEVKAEAPLSEEEYKKALGETRFKFVSLK